MSSVSKETEILFYKKPVFLDEIGKAGKEAGTYIKYLIYKYLSYS